MAAGFLPQALVDFFSGPFIPHGHCYLWKPELVWLHLLSDSLIAFAYYSIPLTLLYFVRKRQDLPFDWIFLLFGTFIIACGTTHIMEVWTLWHPDYWLSGLVKVITAIVSLYTAFQLVPLVPQALALPSPAQLEAANIELQASKDRIQEINAELEQRVQERTVELETSNRLKDELLVREQQTRAEAEAANRAKDEFLSILSHELRTPLNAILGWTQLLRSRTLSSEKNTNALETIERNAKSQVQMIEDILDVSRIVTGKMRLHVRPVELSSVIAEALEAMQPAAEAKNIRIQSILDPAAGPVSGDPERLQQVVWNLLSNAIKFTPKGGRVQVRLERVNSHVEITVSDTGQGIAPEFLPFIFERFRQSDSSTTRKYGGLGLGLAICRHLVELHGGVITADSAGEGQGATFVVNLPLMILHARLNDSDRAHPAANRASGLAEVPSLAGIQVLVVDDEPDARELLTTVLEEEGAEVQAVASAQEALQVITQAPTPQRPDVLISDIGMPEEDGYSLIRRLRLIELEQGGRIPAVALTAYARSEDRQQALLAGFQLHIPKPVQPAELVAAVASLAGRTGPVNHTPGPCKPC